MRFQSNSRYNCLVSPLQIMVQHRNSKDQFEGIMPPVRSAYGILDPHRNVFLAMTPSQLE